MNPLHNLRLNCLLLPAVFAALAGGTVTWMALAGEEGRQAAHRQHLASAIGSWAILRGKGAELPPEMWLRADRRWTGAALLRMRDDRAVILASAGELALRADGPPPGLSQSVAGPGCYEVAGPRLAASCVIRDADGLVQGFVYAECPVLEPELAWLPWFWSACLILAAVLGWYLTRHLWRPFEAAQATIDAALAGKPSTEALSASEETALLQSSVILLAERSRSSGRGVATEVAGDEGSRP